MKSKVLIKVTGKNINNFIKRLSFNNIELLNISNVKYNEALILIYKKDFENVVNFKTIYDVTEKQIYGIIKVRQMVKLHKLFLIAFVLNVFLIIFLSNVIFNVNVIHENSEIRSLIENELSLNNLSKYKFKKSAEEIESIKESILNKYKDKIEWLEIIEEGTSYIIRVEERIIDFNNDVSKVQNIVASKSGILKKIDIDEGVVLKNINSYVMEGEIVVSSDILLNDNIVGQTEVSGNIYAEVWYTVEVSYPYVYNEQVETKNKANVYTFNFLNKSYELNEKYENKKVLNNVLLNHLFLPISFSRQDQTEVFIIDEVLTEEEVYKRAYEKAIDSINTTLASDEYIIKSEVLKNQYNINEINLTVFFSVYENITAYKEVEYAR